MSSCPALIQWYNNILGFFFFDLGVRCSKEKMVRRPTSLTVSDKAFPTRPLHREVRFKTSDEASDLGDAAYTVPC